MFVERLFEESAHFGAGTLVRPYRGDGQGGGNVGPPLQGAARRAQTKLRGDIGPSL